MRTVLGGSPEASARLGRTLQRTSPELVRTDWTEVKVEVMQAALRAKLTRHAAVRRLLLSSAGRDGGESSGGKGANTGSAGLWGAGGVEVLEDSPCDAVWGVGRDGKGENLLGEMFMQLRDELGGSDSS